MKVNSIIEFLSEYDDDEEIVELFLDKNDCLNVKIKLEEVSKYIERQMK